MLRFAGYDAIIVQGAAKRWMYLYTHDGVAELRDAAHLQGKDTWETQDSLVEEVGESNVGSAPPEGVPGFVLAFVK